MPDPAKPHSGFRRSLAQSMFGWDMFISHRAKSRSYALELRDQLQKKGFVVFVDDSDLHAGTAVESYIREARKSRMFVLIGTDDILRSQHVPREISAHCKRRGWTRLVPISVDGALKKFQSPECPIEYAETPWKALFGKVSEPENGAAIAKGHPSTSVLNRIVDSYDVVRGKVRLLRLTLIVGLLLATAVVITGLRLTTQQKRIGAAESLLSLTEQRSKDLDQQIASKQADLIEKQTELLQKEKQVEALNNDVTKKQLEIGSLQRRINASTTELTKTRGENTKLSNDNKELAQRNDLARARLRATDMLRSDPVVAYRLAEKIVSRLAPPNDKESEALLFEAASKAIFPYQTRFQQCEVEQVNAPWALLECNESDKQVWKVLSLQKGTLEREYRIGSQAGYAWIAPHGSSFRLMRYAIETHQTQEKSAVWRMDLLDDSGTVISSVRDHGFRLPEMCGSDRLFVNRGDGRNVHILDAHTGKVSVLRSALNAATAFISCKENGTVSVVAHESASSTLLELFDRKGEPSRVTLVGTGGHYEWEYSESTWSPDGRLLAIWGRIPGGGRLTILDPVAKTITEVSPKNWVDTAFAWRNDQKLVVAGHHRDATDFQVGLLDATVPNAQRQVLQHLSAQTQDIATLPNDLFVEGNVDGVLRITSPSGNATAAEGRHPNLERVYVIGGLLLSSSFDEVRLWQLNPPTTHLIFRSTKDRRYLPCVAGDPTYQWLAAGFSTEKGIGIELRSIDGSKSPDPLALPAGMTDCSVLAFTQDGRWLAAFGRTGGVVFNTTSWVGRNVVLDDERREPLELLSPSVSIHRGGLDISEFATKSYRQRVDFSIDLTGDVPKVSTITRKALVGDMIGFCLSSGFAVNRDPSLYQAFLEHIERWQKRLPEYPVDTKLMGCTNSGWVARILLYNETESEPRRWDIEFIPMDAKRLTHLFDPIVLRIPDDEISAILNKNTATKNGVK